MGNENKHPLDSLSDFLKTEEGERRMAEMHAHLEEQHRIKVIRFKKLELYLESHDFDEVMSRVKKEHGEEYRARMWKKGYEPYPNNKLQLLLSYLESTFDPVDTHIDDKNPFKAAEWFFKGYLFQLSIGQGSFWRIWWKRDDKHEEFLTV